MKEFWNNRYAGEEFAYGENPNAFFKQEIQKLKPGKILLPSEGEGRNAVYAAKLGWEVTAFDFSPEGKRKAEKLALKFGVEIDYQIQEFSVFKAEEARYDCIGLIFTHAKSKQLKLHHQLVQKWIKPGGTILLQGFSKYQIAQSSGGPQNIDMLFDRESLMSDFKLLNNLKIEEKELELNEGDFHKGLASLIEITGQKAW